jgi:hypothetical protein
MRRRFFVSPAVLGVALLTLGLLACGARSDTIASRSITTMATVPPSATATPQTLGVVTAVLGGPVEAFYAKYGRKQDNSFDANGVTFSLTVDIGADSTDHVREILVVASDAHVWTQEQAKPICIAFLPPDATFTRSSETAGGFPVDVYTSAQARASFDPSSTWYSADGTVSIVYDPPPNGASGVAQCLLLMGF